MHGGDIYSNPDVRLDFSVNCNPLGMPEAIKKALRENIDAFATYPDAQCRKLTAEIAQNERFPMEQILCGNGAADLILRLCLALRPKKVLLFQPTFSEYAKAAQLANAEIVNSFEQKPDMLFLCHPNNPTGILQDSELLREISDKCVQNGIIQIMDECFLDFTDGISARVFLHKNMVILRAFTKNYAMAGLRLGYMLTPNREILKKTRDFGQSWSVSAPAQIAGLAALSSEGWMDKSRKIIMEEKRFLYAGLEKLGIQYHMSDANFFLIKSPLPLYDLFLEKGILLRDCSDFSGLEKGYYRICVRLREENQQFLRAMEEILWQRQL